MSVINQMLKDLEERTPEKFSNNSQAVTVVDKTSPVKLGAIILVVLLILNAIGLYVWSLLQENQALKAETVSLAVVVPKAQPSSAQSTAMQSKPRQQEAVKAKLQANTITKNKTAETVEPATNESSRQQEVLVTNTLNTGITESTVSESVANESVTSKAVISMQAKAKLNDVALNESKLTDEIPKASMSVSRRQLTTAELIEQKLAKAVEAINANKLSIAEQLFEEILILAPDHQQARKKLAALWFGRKSYNDAINLLSQGIHLAPQNSEFRAMQARVYLQQGKLTQAYNVLMPLDNLQQQEYQLLIVNISQQISAYASAIKAYKILLDIQPKNTRWHLGLAIVYDKNSQFVLAVNEYNVALEQNGLSQDSRRFAKQRIQALGVN